MSRFLLALTFLALSCGTAGTTTVGTAGTAVIDCAEAGVHQAALELLSDVALAVATGDYASALADLVKRFGEGAVDCAVREIGGTSNHNAQTTNDPLERTKAQHAQAWLASRPVMLK